MLCTPHPRGLMGIVFPDIEINSHVPRSVCLPAPTQCPCADLRELKPSLSLNLEWQGPASAPGKPLSRAGRHSPCKARSAREFSSGNVLMVCFHNKPCILAAAVWHQLNKCFLCQGKKRPATPHSKKLKVAVVSTLCPAWGQGPERHWRRPCRCRWTGSPIVSCVVPGLPVKSLDWRPCCG